MYKTTFSLVLAFAIMLCAAISCRPYNDLPEPIRIDYSAVSAPAEAGIVFTRITQEGASVSAAAKAFTNYLAISPDGNKIAFLSKVNSDENIFTIDMNNKTITQQRTYRNNIGGGFGFSPDGENLIFSTKDNVIFQTNASSGAICKQIAAGYWASYSSDGKYIYFQRTENDKQYLWRYTVDNKDLATLCQGFGPVASKEENVIYYGNNAKRNNRSFYEIRKLNCATGSDEVIFSNENVSPRMVHESPDGKWLLFAARPYNNGDWQDPQLYVLRTDGTDLIQLTYHVAPSFSPIWSKDGKKIYFISGRGTKDCKYGIWSMDFNL